MADLVRPGGSRELRGIGPGIEARLRELVETGEIAELAELERDLAPDLIGLGRYLGLSAKRSIELARALDVRTADEFRAAAAAGRLGGRAGDRSEDRGAVARGAGRERESASAPGPAAESSARAGGRGGIAAGGLERRGVAEVAGDVRRWRDSCEQLAVVCRAPDAASVIERFADLPQIVGVIERDERRALSA